MKHQGKVQKLVTSLSKEKYKRKKFFKNTSKKRFTASLIPRLLWPKQTLETESKFVAGFSGEFSEGKSKQKIT